MDVLCELREFYKNFKGEKGYIGCSGNGKLIPYFAVKKTVSPIILVQYAIHAREYVTTYLAMQQIKEFEKNGKIGTVYFIPAVNVDGIKIALKQNPLYKANAFGVDLNVNFDAKWGTGSKNVREKGSENFIGDSPFSEIESRNLRDFTLDVMPDMTVSYHSKGEEIYYEFYQDKQSKIRDKMLAQTVANVTGYKIKSTPNSAGGYKDWCIERLGIPAITVEVGDDSIAHPLKKQHVSLIFEKNKRVVSALMDKLLEIKCKKNL